MSTYEVRLTPGQRLRHAREEQAMEQKEVAQRLRVDRSKVSNWERGVQTIDFESAKRLGALINAPWWWLMGFDSLTDALEPSPWPIEGPDFKGDRGASSTIW